jgi:hypothetical protein
MPRCVRRRRRPDLSEERRPQAPDTSDNSPPNSGGHDQAWRNRVSGHRGAGFLTHDHEPGPASRAPAHSPHPASTSPRPLPRVHFPALSPPRAHCPRPLRTLAQLRPLTCSYLAAYCLRQSNGCMLAGTFKVAGHLRSPAPEGGRTNQGVSTLRRCRHPGRARPRGVRSPTLRRCPHPGRAPKRWPVADAQMVGQPRRRPPTPG